MVIGTFGEGDDASSSMAFMCSLVCCLEGFFMPDLI